MSPGEQGVLAVAVASGITVLAVLLFAAGARRFVQFIPRLVPFAVGAMLGAAAFHLLPLALSRTNDNLSVIVLAASGVVAFALVDFLASRASVRSGGAVVAAGMGSFAGGTIQARRLTLTIASDALHNFIDGILIATSFLAQPTLGVITAAAVALHEVPRELGTFALCVSSGLTVKRALAIAALTGVLAIMGAMLVVTLGPSVTAIGYALVPFAAGNFIFLAGSIVWESWAETRSNHDAPLFVLLVVAGILVTLLAAH